MQLIFLSTFLNLQLMCWAVQKVRSIFVIRSAFLVCFTPKSLQNTESLLLNEEYNFYSKQNKITNEQNIVRIDLNNMATSIDRQTYRVSVAVDGYGCVSVFCLPIFLLENSKSFYWLKCCVVSNTF